MVKYSKYTLLCLAGLLVFGCGGGSEEAALSTESGAAAEATDAGETGVDWHKTPWVDVMGPDVFGGCKDLHHFGDAKGYPNDRCWDPPHHYCANGTGSEIVHNACTADFSVCCGFGTDCIPCGWVDCGTCEGPECVHTIPGCDHPIETQPNPLCAQPDILTPICWDDLPPDVSGGE